MSNLFNPALPISSFLSLPTSNPSSKKITKHERRNIYGTQWITENQRTKSEIRKKKYRDSFSRPSTASTSNPGQNLELKRLQHDQNRLATTYLETNKNQEIKDWLLKKDLESKARRKKRKGTTKS